MGLDIDGFEMLRLIGGRPKLFPGVAIDAKAVARKLAVKQIGMTGTLEELNGICKYLGRETFVLLLDGFSPTALRKVIKRLDPYQLEFKKASAPWLRDHLIGLAIDERKPSPKPEPLKTGKARAQKSKGKGTTKSGRKTQDKPAPAAEPKGFFWGTAMGRTRQR